MNQGFLFSLQKEKEDDCSHVTHSNVTHYLCIKYKLVKTPTPLAIQQGWIKHQEWFKSILSPKLG